MQTQNPTTADVILSQLSLWGIKHMYGVAGDAIIPLLDAIQDQTTIQYYAVRHESSAAFMASAQAKLTGTIGICIATSGPGLANMLNGIADAAADHVPLLVITGQVKSDQVGTEAKQYIDQEKLIDPLAVYSTSLLHPAATVNVVHKAMIEAISKKGVAHLSVPKDVLAQPCSETPQTPLGLIQQTRAENLHRLEDVVVKLSSCQKPVIYIGEGARTAAEWIVPLAEKLQAGIIETLGAKGVVPSQHELNLGGIGVGGTVESAELLKQSDCLLIIGANWYPQGFAPNKTEIIKIDINPAHIESQHDVTLGLVGDAAHLLPLLYEKVIPGQRGAWHEQLMNTKEAIVQGLNKERQSTGSVITPPALMAALEAHLASDAIIALDTGDHTLWFNRIFQAHGQDVTFSGKWRTMGYGLPAGLSAKIHHPHRQVTVITGDGSFMMTMMELSTLVKYNLPLKIIIANNQTLAAEKSKMSASGVTPFGVDLTNPDFSTIAAAFGLVGIKVDRSEQLPQALAEMYAHDQTVLLDIHITDLRPPLAGYGSS